MQTAAPNDVNLTRKTALPQLGLRPEATAQEIDAAYSTAVAEIELMTRNSRSEALSASYRWARDQIERAYEVLKGIRPNPALRTAKQPDASSNAAKPDVGATSRGTAVEVVVELADAASLSKSWEEPPGGAGSLLAESSARKTPAAAPAGASETPGAPAANLDDEITRTRQESARVREEAARARDETAKAREATASAQKVLAELGAQSQALAQDLARVRDRLKSLGDEAEAMRQTVSQLAAQTTREMDAIAQARKHADGLLLSAQRNESEIATAAMHAEAYRDSAMYAAQAAERVLRALSAEATNT